MYEVTINVGANAKNYWAFLHFEDKEGKVHSREVSGGTGSDDQW